MGGDEFVDTIGTVTGPAKKRYVTSAVNCMKQAQADYNCGMLAYYSVHNIRMPVF
jgi:hypothetical protein